MSDHADTIRRALPAKWDGREQTERQAKITAKASAAHAALDSLVAERQQAIDERDAKDHDLHVASGILAENERTIADLRAEIADLQVERQQAIDERDAAVSALQHFKECADTPLMADVLRDKQQAIDALRRIELWPFDVGSNDKSDLQRIKACARAALVSLGAEAKP